MNCLGNILYILFLSCVFSPSVPILPSYLYSMDQLATRAAENSTVGSTFQPRSNSSVGLNSTAEPPSPASSSDSSIVAQNSSCPNYTTADTLLDHENVKVGVLLASKATIQLITNPFIGPLTNRWVTETVMAKFKVTSEPSSSSSFSYCSCVFGTSPSNAHMHIYPCLPFLANLPPSLCYVVHSLLCLVAGAPFGSVMYEYVGKMSPFLFRYGKNLVLCVDLILLPGAICFSTMAIGMLEASLPIWMMKTMCPRKWQLGINDSHADLRHEPVYGSIYAIANIAICIGFSVGPSVGGPIAAAFGFPWLMAIIGAVNILYAPLCFFLYRPRRQEENGFQDDQDISERKIKHF
uniref:Solute carrier family 18 member 2 n=1 Tax=Myripristis murdjan TaxID=586833 RepID=A0A667XEH0_9TELE